MKRKAAQLSTAGLEDDESSSKNIYTTSKGDLPKFGELLHAASYSQDDQEGSDSWSEENRSSSEPDGAEEDDEDDQLNQSTGGRVCSFVGCTNAARSRGLCPTHGGGTRCQAQDCSKHAVSSGLCVAHGGGRRCRDASGCLSSAVSRGLCALHGGGRQCSEPGCNKHVASSGLCRTHGGGRRCQVPDCASSAQSRGLCYVHGGGGRCQREGCGSSAKKGGLCIAHGGGHRCQVLGCRSSAVSGARCRAHGGGRRCAVEGCASSAKTGGRCIAHGGGKRCTVRGCTSSAQRLGLCKAHGGGRRCIVEGCANSAVSRGRCIAHGGGKRCVFEGCTTTARKGGFCFAHGGRSTASTANSRRKLVPPPSVLSPTAPVRTKPLTWSEVPIPALTLPPRRLLPPIKMMLMVNRPSILRRYQPIPPIRRPVATFGHADQKTYMHDEECPDTFRFDSAWQYPPDNKQQLHMPSPRFQDQVPRTPTVASSRAGYSWQRLQETIRLESRVHGLANDDDSAYEDKPTGKSEDDDQNDAMPLTSSGFYSTRSRGPIRS
ncbi:unnamed protein product [Phytophthora fragariaefolia]|uniref:Unnamed protein product n=1 Tax=Phytophthora fragariaefolia TaxID=1490495 RepID=A0A9W7CT58_9STRA|nr:unnamed protein product [Phytophthora fragariaefolia]